MRRGGGIYGAAQLALAAAMFLAALTSSAVYIARGAVDTPAGYAACAAVTALTWLLAALAWGEYRRGG